MADKNSKASKNVIGSYYVDTNCIGCCQCVDYAGDFFVQDINDGVYVKNQPILEKDIELCERALTACPVESIGNDG